MIIKMKNIADLSLKNFLLFSLIGITFLFAQEKNNLKVIDPSLDAKGNCYMDRQSTAFLKEINNILTQYPPSFPIASERNGALFLLDAVLHDKYAAYRKPVQKFYHERITSVLREINNTKITKGAKIWKLYNMGFIVKTKSTTIAFDFVSGSVTNSEGFGLEEKIITGLVKECDVLFISHKHRDHIDMKIAQAFVDEGKPVVATTTLWKNDPIYKMITHLERNTNKLQILPIQKGKTLLKVVVYPGHQMSNTLNNVPLIFTPEGISVSHMGDQINEGDFMIDYKWIDSVAKNYHVNILLPPSWTNELHRIVKGFDPELVILGHENELSHPVDDRVPFWGDTEYLELTNDELLNSDYKVLQMVWGESFYYKPIKK